MKKIISMFIAAALVITVAASLSACGNKKEAETTTAAETTVAETTAEDTTVEETTVEDTSTATPENAADAETESVSE